MITLSLKQLFDIFSLPVDDAVDGKFCGVSIDSRATEKGNLFIAIIGENFNGHTFVNNAHCAGAVAAIVNESVQAKCPTLLVPNTTQALGQLASYWRDQFDLPFIALTGSSGKTTVKNMIATILRKACFNNTKKFLTTLGNYNNHIGVPLSLLQLNKNHQYAIVEMGMSHFGELEYLSCMVRPNVALINNIFPVHLAGVGHQLRGVAKAKAEIFCGLQKNGTAILNADDQYFKFLCDQAQGANLLTFGIKNKADIYATQIKNDINSNGFILHGPSDKIDITLPLPGMHNVMNALAAAAACIAIGIDLQSIQQGLQAVKPAKQRLYVKQLSNNICVLDDSYSANPASLCAAIDVLVKYSGEKILVLADMKELGDNERFLHFEAGQYAAQAGVDRLITYGDLSIEAANGFGENAHHFMRKPALLEYLKSILAPGMVILVKGSRAMQMEEVVEGLKESVILDKREARGPGPRADCRDVKKQV